MARYTIAASGINAVDNPGSGVGIIRSLKEANPRYRCIGLAYDAMDPGLYLDKFIDKGYLLPYPSSSPERYLERLLYICEENHINVIIPAFDSELPHYIKNRELLAEKGVRVLIPTREQLDATSKPNLPLLAAKLEIKVPLTASVSTLEELNVALEQTGFPAVVKGRFYEAYNANSYAEAHALFQKICAKWGLPVVVQQFIPGNDYNLVGLASAKGKSLGMVPARKLLLTQLGKIWTAVTIDNPKLLEAGKRFIETTRFSGGFEMEFRMTPAEELYLLEINPRFPAWVYLATAAGVNLPQRYVLNALEGKESFKTKYAVGKLLVRFTGELVREMSDFEKIAVSGEKV